MAARARRRTTRDVRTRAREEESEASREGMIEGIID